MAKSRQIELQLPTLVDTAPEGDDWIHELKLDGYRLLCDADGARVRFETRNHLDMTAKLSGVVVAVQKLKLKDTLLDGEAVVLNPEGISDFQLLQNAFQVGTRSKVIFYVFDVLRIAGKDVQKESLDERKALLKQLKLPKNRSLVRQSDFTVGHGPELFQEACRTGLEGIISKRRNRPYVSGRGTDWVKVKCQQHAEFVIGGFTDPGGSRAGFGALLLGYYEEGKLIFAGRVGTGFNMALLADLTKKLTRIEQKTSPFANFPPRGHSKGVHWVSPQLVAQIRFSNWTQDNQLRHPAFLGLRIDKPARQVTREYKMKLSAKKRAGKT
jgi:bifunctional non-homologous end joining protein LigD